LLTKLTLKSKLKIKPYMDNDLLIKIGGEAGFGIMTAGGALAKSFSRAGYHIFSTNEYPSLVRGGHNVVTLRVSPRELFSLRKGINLLIALDKNTIDLHKDELLPKAVVIFDNEEFSLGKEDFKKPVILCPTPLGRLVKNGGGGILMRNTVALGATCAVLNLDFNFLEIVLSDQFKRKGGKVVRENILIAKAGYDYVKKNFPKLLSFDFPKLKSQEMLVLSGNEAIGLGAIAAGLGFAAIYPMTPINSLLTFLAENASKFGFIYKQPEDEIAGINMAIGASFAGARSLVATSGGGFSLMVEGYGMAAMTETPLVIVMGTRPGPSTGLATWTEQGDLKFLLNASQGDFPRFVLAPGDVEEAFYLTIEAFNLADRFQTPVFLLVDKYLCESVQTIEKSKIKNQKSKIDQGKRFSGEKNYKRYQLTSDGISSRAFAGQTYFIANSYEHDEAGFATEDPKIRVAMMDKRMKKLALAEREVPKPEIFGDPNADITLVGWGSTKGPIREAISNIPSARAQDEGKYQISKTKLNYLHLNYINPFPTEAVKKILERAKKIVDVEGNASGQMAGWIREKTGVEIKEKILKYDGRPFLPEDISLKRRDPARHPARRKGLPLK